ncbi:MAG TPA: porin family protein [Flavisolibacter sp.]
MKKISFVMLLVSSVLFATAQTGANFGLKGGLNVATTTNDQGGSRDHRLGFHAGALAHIHLTPNIGLQPEVVYSSQGAKYTVTDGEHILKLNYINVPLQVQYMFNNGFRLQTGPQVGFLVDVEDKNNDVETGFFTSDDFKKTDVSWSFGLGYLSYSGIGVDARYNLGLSNINDFGTAKVKNNVFQVGLFYMFNSNHKAQSR